MFSLLCPRAPRRCSVPALLALLLVGVSLAQSPADGVAPSTGIVRDHGSDLGGEANPEVQPPPPEGSLQARLNHLASLGVDRWHAAGFRGQGVKIAVLDTGFHGYKSFLGNALPAHVTARSFRRDGNMDARDSQHGILVAETVHAIAPDAELILADWDVASPEGFLAAVRWARERGAQIISCSVVSPAWSDGAGGGTIHRDLLALLGSGDHPGDLLLFASAGNTIDRHWSGRFHDAGDGWHEWAPGQRDNPLRPWDRNEIVALHLYGMPGTAYEIVAWDVETGREAGRAASDETLKDRDSAIIRFQPEAGHHYRVRVRLLHGPAGEFHLTSMFSSIEYRRASGSVCFPGDGAEVVAMGAVDEQGEKKWYSACGPNSPQPKPDFVARVPFPSLWRAAPFGGTSAAAPQGSALAALILSRHPGWTPTQVRAALKTNAIDLGPPGHDWETGFGLLHLPTDGMPRVVEQQKGNGRTVGK
jgi:subtilisin family serine protease